jgi:hypothetical protein
MRAVTVNKASGPGAITVEDRTVREPRPGEVRLPPRSTRSTCLCGAEQLNHRSRPGWTQPGSSSRSATQAGG